jgi:RNA polymerase sigma factor (sigma-70 family)
MWKRAPSDKSNPIDRLVARALEGDHAAFEAIIAHYQPGLRRILLRRTGGNSHLAEELIHQAWIGVWDALRNRRYDPSKSAVSTFVYAVAHKLWLQHLRRAGQAPLSGGDLDLSLLMDPGGELSPEPAHELHTLEMLEALRDCLRVPDRPNSLTPEERHIVFGLANEKTERILADELDLAPSTIHARKQLAYMKLRKCMAAKGFHAETSD